MGSRSPVLACEVLGIAWTSQRSSSYVASSSAVNGISEDLPEVSLDLEE